MSREENMESEEESGQYVPAVFAHSAEEAEYYRDLLSDHDIPALVGTDGDEEAEGRRISRGVPVLVPDAFLDEASEIIADREDLDEFEDDQDDEEDEDEEEVEGEEFDPQAQLEEEDDEEEEEDELDEDEDEEDDDFLGLDTEQDGEVEEEEEEEEEP